MFKKKEKYMSDLKLWVKYSIIGLICLVIFGFRGAIGALIGAALYDLWKYWKN